MKTDYKPKNGLYISSYYSPFPREKSNNEVLSQSLAKKIGSNLAVIDIPPEATVTYMKKNPFYFDVKRHTTRQNWRQRPKTAGRASGEKGVMTGKPNYTVYNASKLGYLLKGKSKKFEVPRPGKLNECEKVSSFSRTPQNHPNLTQEEVLKILNKMKFPRPPKNEKFTSVPKYINEFKIREMIEREYERLVEESKDYPKGTFKIWDNDRIVILDNLSVIREELLSELRKFPVDYFWRSYGIQNKRRIIEQKLDEIEYAIKLFKLTDVFLQY